MKGIVTRASYERAKKDYGIGEEKVTASAEAQARVTGKLEPLVDPAGFNVIRLSLPRMGKLEDRRDSTYQLLMGCPLPVETRLDTTGSMGGNVDVAMQVLPEAFESWSKAAEGYDIQVATGIFGDVVDRFPLCRPQFEMEAGKIVPQLASMVPERGGGDAPEDPDLGIFGGAYLCRHYINRIGLKGYDFTVTDAPGRGMVSEDQIIRVFGANAFAKVAENGHEIRKGQLQLSDLWEALLDRAHAFIMLVGDNSLARRLDTEARRFWVNIAGESRVATIPNMQWLPHTQAVIIGLTEGTLQLDGIPDFLAQFNIEPKWADKITEAVSKIPIGAQQQLPNYGRRPMRGDIFDGKPDVWEDKHLWPIESADLPEEKEPEPEEDDWA